MAETAISISLLIPGLIHVLPLYGLIGNKYLESLYGLKFNEPNISILMRHRSVLFGLLGGYLTYSAINPTHRNFAFPAGLISATSFLMLAVQTSGYNAKIRGVVLADVIAIGSLLVGSVLHFNRMGK